MRLLLPAMMILLAGCFRLAGSPPPANALLEERLRILAENYEFELRGYAPYPRPNRHGSSCARDDEIVGEFCLQRAHRSRGIEPPEVGRARALYAAILRQLAAARQHDTLITGPLVRILVEGGRSEEALEVATTFAAADTTDPWSHLLMGFALHANGQAIAAEDAFSAAAARLPPIERERMAEPVLLIAPEERERYRDFTPEERVAYEAKLWRAADPLYLTPGNEVHTEHLARYVWVRLLQQAPRFPWHIRLTEWAPGLRELTRRFGVPMILQGRLIGGLVDPSDPPLRNTWPVPVPLNRSDFGYYDPEQLTHVPPAFSREKLPAAAAPGAEEWFHGPEARWSGFFPHLRPLEHQLSRFPGDDSTVLRADVEFTLDSLISARNGPSVEIGLFVLDSALNVIREMRDTVEALGRIAYGSLETALPPAAWAYSVEARDIDTGRAARARHPLPPAPEGQLLISDVVVARPNVAMPSRGAASFRPFGSLVLDAEDDLALYVEAPGLEPDADGKVRSRLDLTLVRLKAENLESPSISWTHEGSRRMWVDLQQLPADEGLYRLVLTVTDLANGAQATLQRLVRFERD